MAEFISDVGHLAAQLDAAWRAADFQAGAFSDLAVQHLAQLPGRALEDIVRSVAAARLPGQPVGHGLELARAASRRFRLELCPITDCQTDVAGAAYAVLHGAALELHTRFDAATRVSPGLALGALVPVSCGVVERGDAGGSQRLLRLSPSLLILKAEPTAGLGRRVTDFGGGCRITLTATDDHLARKRLSFYRHLRETGNPRAGDFLCRLMRSRPLAEAVLLLLGALEAPEASDAEAILLARMGAAAGELTEVVSWQRAEAAGIPSPTVRALAGELVASAWGSGGPDRVGELLLALAGQPCGSRVGQVALAAAPRRVRRWRAPVTPWTEAVVAAAAPPAPIPADGKFIREIEELAHRVAETWAQHDHAFDRFSEIAAAALRAVPGLTESLSVAALIPWLAGPGQLPEPFTPGDSFGSPSLTLWRSDDGRFAVEVLFWRRADTAIHDHGFAGAWAVIDGLSIEARYRFQAAGPLAAGVREGQLELVALELIPRGPARPIEAGAGFIHQVIHLAHPTVSLVVRTLDRGGREPQFTYCRDAAPERRPVWRPSQTQRGAADGRRDEGAGWSPRLSVDRRATPGLARSKYGDQAKLVGALAYHPGSLLWWGGYLLHTEERWSDELARIVAILERNRGDGLGDHGEAERLGSFLEDFAAGHPAAAAVLADYTALRAAATSGSVR